MRQVAIWVTHHIGIDQHPAQLPGGRHQAQHLALQRSIGLQGFIKRALRHGARLKVVLQNLQALQGSLTVCAFTQTHTQQRCGNRVALHHIAL